MEGAVAVGGAAPQNRRRVGTDDDRPVKVVAGQSK